jgi:hypothetical protein
MATVFKTNERETRPETSEPSLHRVPARGQIVIPRADGAKPTVQTVAPGLRIVHVF